MTAYNGTIRIKKTLIGLAMIFAGITWVMGQEQLNTEKHRLLILADMGNEPDEVQQMLHMLMYNNEFDLEGLIAVTGKYLNPQSEEAHRRVLHPELFYQLIASYEQVLPNLKLHASGWANPDYLRSIVYSGQTGYGINAAGDGQTSPGSELIKRAVLKEDSRPLYIVVNAGSNTLAQTLIDYRAKHSEEEVNEFVSKMIVYENGAQDDAGAWIMHEFPKLHWIRSNFQTYGFMGGDGPNVCEPYPDTALGQHAWAKEHIQTNHGALGDSYPDRIFSDKVWTLEGGGTTPWLGLITRGLYSPLFPHWGGWSGRYSKEKQENVLSRHKDIAPTDKKHTPFFAYTDIGEKWTDPVSGQMYDSHFSSIFRWRRDILKDFQARMDWCIQPRQSANHNPVASVNGNEERCITLIAAKPGEKLTFDASNSYDLDTGQTLGFSWWVYTEAGTYHKPLKLKRADQEVLTFKIPKDASGKEIHLILDVFDDSDIAIMHDYRRFVLTVAD